MNYYQIFLIEQRDRKTKKSIGDFRMKRYGLLRYRRRCLLTALTLLASPGQPSANGVYNIEVDAEVTLGAGDQLGLECNDFLVAGTFQLQSGRVVSASNVTISSGGTLDGGSGILDVEGNWTNQGNFHAGSGRIQLLGGCTAEPIQVTGNTTFCHLDLSNNAREYVFSGGQIITIQCSLNLGQGNHLSASGGAAYIQLGPNASVTGTADLDQVVIQSPIPIPTVSTTGLLILALFLAGMATRSRRLRS